VAYATVRGTAARAAGARGKKGASALRVLIVNAHGDDPTCGGTERAVSELTDGLIRVGSDVAYLQAFPQRIQGRELERTILNQFDWRDSGYSRLKTHVASVLSPQASSLDRAIRQHRPDIVHTHNLTGIGTRVWEVCNRLGVPVVHTAWDYFLMCPRVTLTRRDGTPCRPSPFFCGLRTRNLSRWAGTVSHVIGCSRHVLDIHGTFFPNASFHVLRSPIAGVGGEVRPPRAKPAMVGYIGALDTTKGVDRLLQGAAGLKRLGLRLRLAGDGRLRSAVIDATERHSNVEWLGLVTGDHKRRFFESCDLGIVPSVWAEPGGPTFTMIEWLTAGRPVLVSNRGGLGEVAGVYPGSVAIEPSVESILEAIKEACETSRWSELVGAARSSGSRREVESWTTAHTEIYRVARGDIDVPRSVATQVG
jgi:glycosyltransferase involved in cell wall biosynthesis